MAKQNAKQKKFKCHNCGKIYGWKLGDKEGCPNCGNIKWAQEEIKTKPKKKK